MKISVAARPGAKEEFITQIDDSHFVVAVKEPPMQGRANAAIRRALAKFYCISPARLRLISGFASRSKVFEIMK